MSFIGAFKHDNSFVSREIEIYHIINNLNNTIQQTITGLTPYLNIVTATVF